MGAASPDACEGQRWSTPTQNCPTWAGKGRQRWDFLQEVDPVDRPGAAQSQGRESPRASLRDVRGRGSRTSTMRVVPQIGSGPADRLPLAKVARGTFIRMRARDERCFARLAPWASGRSRTSSSPPCRSRDFGPNSIEHASISAESGPPLPKSDGPAQDSVEVGKTSVNLAPSLTIPSRLVSDVGRTRPQQLAEMGWLLAQFGQHLDLDRSIST